MLIGQSVLAAGNEDPGLVYYTPWMPRQGNNFTAVVEVIAVGGSYTLTCALQTKNSEDSDASPSAIGSGDTSASAPTTLTVSNTGGALELVRYKFTAASGTTSATWIHFRSNAPIWQPN